MGRRAAGEAPATGAATAAGQKELHASLRLTVVEAYRAGEVAVTMGDRLVTRRGPDAVLHLNVVQACRAGEVAAIKSCSNLRGVEYPVALLPALAPFGFEAF